jgi:hypothetical protein
MFRFTIRDVLWLTVVVALGVALWLERQQRFNAGPSRFPTLTDSHIIEACQRLNTGKSGPDMLAEWKRGNLGITKDRIAEYDELRTATGPSRIHHTHYRCTIHNEQTNQSEFIFIDFNQLGYINSPTVQQKGPVVWSH